MSRPYRIPVVAALLEQDGKVVVCQRKAGARHELKWEFPGGKVEAGESPRVALARELREELGIDAAIGRELTRYEVQYPKGVSILLIFLTVKSFRGELKPLEFEQIAWEDRANLLGYDFLDGDLPFVRQLANGVF